VAASLASHGEADSSSDIDFILDDLHWTDTVSDTSDTIATPRTSLSA
jgi:hypothetical protein